MARDDKKKRRRSGFIDVLAGLLSLLVIGMVVGVGLFLWGVSIYNAAGPSQEDSTFFIERGNSVQTVANRLAEQGIVTNPDVFRYGSMVIDRSPRILPGEYLIPARSSMWEVFNIITSGEPKE